LLLRLCAGRHRLVLTSHHVLLDGWSTPLVLGEMSTAYAGGQAPPMSPSYRDYLAWLSRQDEEATRSAWRSELAGADEPTVVDADAGRAMVMPGDHSEWLPEEATRALTDFARGHGLTVSTIVQGAWALVLARLAGHTDVVFGTVASGRPADVPDVERMVGMFINTIPVRVRLDGSVSVLELLQDLQRRQSALTEHQYMGLAEIQRVAGVGAAFDTMVMIENYPHDAAGLGVDGGVAISSVLTRTGTSYPLTMNASPGKRLRINVSYRPDRIGADTAAEVARQVGRVVQRVVAEPSLAVGRLSLTSGATRASVVEHWNATGDANGAPSVVELFRRQSDQAPDAVAVEDGERTLSYAQLDEESERLAGYLAGTGVRRGDHVGVVLGRGADLVLALLAIWKAGAAYVPVNVGDPAERIERVLADAGASVAVCAEATRGAVPAGVRPVLVSAAEGMPHDAPPLAVGAYDVYIT
jgi:nonribosomal peptide synthetase CepB